MKVDLYTKIVLTVIAVCLILLCWGKLDFVPQVDAQIESEKVDRYRLFRGRYQHTGKEVVLDIDGVFLVDTIQGKVWEYKTFILPKDNKLYESFKEIPVYVQKTKDE